MEEFIVSARKYRPASFSTLVGQDNIAATLKNSIIKGQLAHAYLFCGPRGVGKTSSARIFAKTINCLNPTPDMEPCGECESCRAFQEGRSFTIHELDAASNNSVEDIRQLIDQVRIQPQVGKYSVFIIDEVHMLSSAAFNAFLKTLEEPPAHAIFILATTEKHKILPTILSRCQVYDFSRISIEGIMSNLRSIAEKEGIAVEDSALHIIAMKADGAMRDALTLFDQMTAFCGRDIKYADVIRNLNVLDYEYYFRITDLILEGKHTETLLLFAEIIGKGFNPLVFISGLSSHLRDLLVSKDERSVRLLEVPESIRQKYIDQSASTSVKFLYNALSVTSAAEAGYRQSTNKRLHIEFALFKLCRLHDTATAEEKPAIRIQTEKTAGQMAAAKPMMTGPSPSVNEGTGNEGKPAQTTQTAQTIQTAPAENKETDGNNSIGHQETVPVTKPETASVNTAAVSEAKPVQERPAAPRSRLSIKAITEMAEKNRLSAKTTEKKLSDKPFTAEDLNAAWLEMAKAEKAPRLSSTLAMNMPSLGEDGVTVTFMVSNSVQKSWMEDNCLSRLQKFLQEKLDNSGIKLKIEVKPHEETGKPRLYMPDEKARFMLEQNPQLEKLRKDLDLEIK